MDVTQVLLQEPTHTHTQIGFGSHVWVTLGVLLPRPQDSLLLQLLQRWLAVVFTFICVLGHLDTHTAASSRTKSQTPPHLLTFSSPTFWMKLLEPSS